MHATPFIAALFSAAVGLAATRQSAAHLSASVNAKADSMTVSIACADNNAAACAPAVLTFAAAEGSVPTTWSTQAEGDSAIYKMYCVREGDTLRAECFASEADRAVCLRIIAQRRGSINAVIGLSSPARHHTKGAARQLIMTGHAADTRHAPTRFCYMLKADADSAATVSAPGGTLLVGGATQLTLYVVGETAADGSNTPYIEQCTDDAWHLVNYTYEQLRSRHTTVAATAAKHAKHKHRHACKAQKSL